MKASGEYEFATVDIRSLSDDALDDIIGGGSIIPASCLMHFACVP